MLAPRRPSRARVCALHSAYGGQEGQGNLRLIRWAAYAAADGSTHYGCRSPRCRALASERASAAPQGDPEPVGNPEPVGEGYYHAARHFMDGVMWL